MIDIGVGVRGQDGDLVIKVGISVHDSLMVADPAARRKVLDRAAAAGLHHVMVGDHVSFHGGTGFDGLIAAASALSTHDELQVIVGVYQLALRHPVLAARQLASISEFAPGRLVFGVGAGGEDRSEVGNSGVDPATRGRRLDEALEVLRELATGKTVDHAGEFFQLSGAAVLPAPEPPVPVVVGGKGDAAVRRTARFGDGWLGMFCSARRFGDTRQRIIAAAEDLGRPAPAWYGLNVWCGLDADEANARDMLARKMESLYHLPYEKFQHLAPAGRPAQVADRLAGYVELGADSITIVPAAGSVEAGVDAVAEVRDRLLG
jgi:alkanesulfonate monooxygenase SsuD/methylene tetrahydromethanopterin reductase-like flavin-dependent oxidoreductase (luciferase family)